MSLYLPVNLKGTAAIAICPRCRFKVQYGDLVQDPNTKLWVCPDCKDVYDPWRLPARLPEKISLDHPRRDDDLI
jgi:NAD-dependent SIR2 family protein deacetylase